MQLTNLLVKNDANTDQALVGVSSANNGSCSWRTNAAGVPVSGQTRLTLVEEEQLKNGTIRSSVKLEVPSMETLNGGTSAGYVAAPSVAYVTVGIFTIFSPARATNADRANVVRMMVHLLMGAELATSAGLPANTAASGAYAGAGPEKQILYNFVNLIRPN